MKKTETGFKRARFLTKETIVLFVLVCMSICNLTYAQEQATYSGKVTDETGLVVPSVTILLKGQSNGTITDVNGQFTLMANEGDVIVISFIGYKDQEITLGAQRVLEVQLVPDMENLDEVVVVGYGTLDKKEVTSAITHVSGDQFVPTASTNPIDAIQGQVSGLTISNTGGSDPNSGASIQLRGVTSMEAGSSPLIVIDGIPGGNLENINQNDIQSIDVLKDGAASAIYGTQGSNGVIIITTKTGRSGAMQTFYDGYAAFNLPTNQLEVLSAEEFVKSGRGTDYGYKTDWAKELIRDFSFTQSHTLAVSGGNESSNYRATVDYRDAQGLDLRSGREEYGARVALNHSGKNNRYKVSLNIAPRIIKKDNTNYDAFTKALQINPTYPVKDPENPYFYQYIPSGSDGAFNPVELLDLEHSGSEVKLLNWSGAFQLNITDDLNSRVSVSQNLNDNFDYWFVPSTMSSKRISEGGITSEASRGYHKSDQRNFDWITNYKLNLGHHSLKAMVGYSYQYNVWSGLTAENKDFTSNDLLYNNLGDGTYMSEEEGRKGMGSYKGESKLIAFFGRINYAINGKYMASASLRREGSTKFGINNKWGNFPAFSVGWRISNEPFMENFNWVNDLKIRADYGVTGNQSFDSYRSLVNYTGFGEYYFNGDYYVVWGPDGNPNPQLKWEKAKNYNIGLDFSLFNYKVSGSLNYYNRRQEDLLNYYPKGLPLTGDNVIANVGTMENKGLEIDLNVEVLKNNDWTYNIGFNASTNNNEFVSFSNDVFVSKESFKYYAYLPAPGSPGPAQRLEEGKRVGSFYMWKFAGVDQFGNMLVYSKDGEPIQAHEATDEDKAYVGNGMPTFNASMSHRVKYKNWDLSLNVRGAFGHEIFNMHDFYFGLQSSPLDENVLTSAYSTNELIKGDKVLCDYFIEKGDYVKIDAATLGYTLKTDGFLSSLRVYATAKNFATFTGFTGVGPEIYPVNGLTPGVSGKGYYPSTATYMMGVQVKF